MTVEEEAVVRTTATTAKEEAVVRTASTTVIQLEAVNIVNEAVGCRAALVSHTMLLKNIVGRTEAAIMHPVNAQGELRTTRTQQPSQIAWEGQALSIPMYHDGRRRN